MMQRWWWGADEGGGVGVERDIGSALQVSSKVIKQRVDVVTEHGPRPKPHRTLIELLTKLALSAQIILLYVHKRTRLN